MYINFLDSGIVPRAVGRLQGPGDGVACRGGSVRKPVCMGLLYFTHEVAAGGGLGVYTPVAGE